ncbi:hypothetical protein LAJ54_17595, partial [Streptococcus pneumoniae]|nr:hypothetical protein [Streptococcus pneumoniae]
RLAHSYQTKSKPFRLFFVILEKYIYRIFALFLGKSDVFLVSTVKVLKKKGTIMSVIEIKDLHVEIEGKEI